MIIWVRAAACAIAGASMVSFAGGVASAEPSVVGMTYAKAKAAQSAGINATVATMMGSSLAQDDCIVTNQVYRRETRTGLSTLPAQFLVSLNCYGDLASATKSGSSAASPEGAEAKKKAKELEWRKSPVGQEWCGKAKSAHPDWFPIEGCPD